MAVIEDFVESASGGGAGVAVAGIGAAALAAPAILRVTGLVLRPVAKITVQTGIVLYRATVGPVGVALADLVSEAQAELDATAAATGGAKKPAVAATPTLSRPPRRSSRKRPPTAPKQKRAPRTRRREVPEV